MMAFKSGGGGKTQPTMCANLALSKMISKGEYKYSKSPDTKKPFNHASPTLSPVPAEPDGWLTDTTLLLAC